MKMKKKRFLSLILMLVMLVSTLVMSGCGIEKKSGDEGNYDGELVYDHSMELQYAKLFSVDYYKGGYKLITITNRDEDTAIVSKQSKRFLAGHLTKAFSGLFCQLVDHCLHGCSLLYSSC